MGRASTCRRHHDLLATYEVLAAGRTEELNELQRAAVIGVKLAKIPEVEGRLGLARGQRPGQSQRRAELESACDRS